MPLALVIFDCDGVLIDSEPIANRVFRERLAAVGLRLPLEEVMRTFVGKTRGGCIEVAGRMLKRPLPEDFAAGWDEALNAALRAELKPVEGVPELLAAMTLPFCVASNAEPGRMAIALEAAGLMPFVRDHLFTASEVKHPKPAPDLFLHAARHMGAKPSDCVVVEDTSTGVKAAIAAGMKVFGYVGAPYADAARLRAEGAVPFTSMRELPGLLERA